LISPEKEAVQNEAAFFSPDGKSLYYLTDGGSEFEYLARYEIATGSTEKVLQADWDVAYAGLSRSNKYILVGINRDARTELRMYEFGSMRRHDLPEVNGDITSARLSNDDKQLAMYVTGSAIPSDLFVSDLKQSRPRQLTSSLNPAIDPDDLVEAEVKWFESFDGLEVPGIYYQPRDVSARNTAPALVWVHGGPGGQSRVGYSALIQYLVNHGYVVYAINNRGSSGYGKTFFHLDDRKHGEDDLQDCVEAKNWLGNMPQVDAGRIGIIGGSYGGFMVLAALTFRPEAFDVGVDIFGISNWHRTVNSIPPWWESYRMALESEMGDFDDEEFFKAKSPIFHYENIEKPLMVLQGANDPRVLQVESDEIVEAVRANGIPVEYVLFPDEGHGFRQKQNRITGYKAILQFLDTYLSGDRPTTGQ
jgi:dipeptidyl aminopeptidase/acylaminoacyl peptidase